MIELKTLWKANMNAKKLAQQVATFKALGHPTRFRMLEMLENGELCVRAFQKVFKIDFSTVSRHLTLLKEAGVVKSERRGKNVFYTLRYDGITTLLNNLKER